MRSLSLMLVALFIITGEPDHAGSSEAEDTLPAYADLLPTTPTFPTARSRMYRIHAENPITLYCGCDYADKKVSLFSCGLENQEGFRWERTEAEHVVPASVLGESRPCWEEGGRTHCLETDPIYKAAHNDLHNLQPAVGGINEARSNKGVGILSGDKPAFGTCDFEVDEVNDRVEPVRGIQGDIARTYFYMEWMYGATLTPGQRRLFLHWHQKDPVGEWERRRNELIFETQGNRNPFIR